MIALVASILIALYLLIPSSLFRLCFGLYVPLRNFERTRSEEILQGLLSTVLPIIIAVSLIIPFRMVSGLAARADYKLVFSALYSEDIFAKSGGAFWAALGKASTQEVCFLLLYYFLIAIEGLGLGKLANSYPQFDAYPKDKLAARIYKWLAKSVLLPSISEWHLLLTPFFFSDKATAVRAEILSSDGILYRGIVVEHSSDKNGRLVGIILSGSARFRREDYLEDKKKTEGEVDRKVYWRTIPGTKLYIMADKILNLNLSYDGPKPAPTDLMEKVISRQLEQPISISVERKALSDPML